MTQLLESKNAIIYGAGGSLGGAVARTFAREGAAVFLAGRHAEPLKAVAADVTAAGGTAEVAVVDALDEEAVAAHAADVVARRGTLDVSFNLITRGDVQGIPFLDLATNFVTARAAARHMVPQGSGVILSLTSASSIGTAPAMGGTGPADAAIEALMRYLAAEWGPSGVRVVGLWTAGVVESLTDEKIGAVAGPGAPSAAQLREMLAQAATLRRSPRLEDVAETALFLASDRAAAVTASIVNVTCGLVIPA